MDLLVFEKFAVITINVLGIFLGISIYLANKKSKQHFLFLLTSIIMLLWIDSSFFLNYSNENHLVLLSGKINLATFSLFCASIYLFIKNFPRDSIRFSIKDAFATITGILLFSVTLFSNVVIKSIIVSGTERKWILNYGVWLIYFYSVSIAVLIIANLYKKYKTADKDERSKIMYFIISAITFISLNIIFNIVVPTILGNDNYYFIGDYSIILFLVLISVAITKNHLFNIKVIAVQSTVILISLALLIETILSVSISQGIVQSIIWILATYGGYVLIKSVKKEIQQREELSLLAKKLDKANMDLEQLDEAKDNFLSMAAHELNTPIAAIEGYLSMIIEENMGGKIPVKALGYLKNVFLSSKRLAGLVHDLLNVSRIESNRIHIVYAGAQIEETIDQAIAEVKIKADEVGHKLTFEKPSKLLPKTYFDVPRIVEVIINIIGNAIKYTDAPGKIVVKCHADDGKIVVSVEDNGRGIPKERAEHVFEKFTQVNVLTDQIKGSGLGMFISKNLIELHKGKLWFESSTDEKDHGTTFYFSLPIIKTEPFDPHEGEGALFQTRAKKTNQEGTANNTDSEKEQEQVATTTNKAPIAEIEKLTGDSKASATNSLASKLEAEIPADGKKKEAKTDDTKTDKESEKLIKQAVKEAEKAPTTSLNETMSKLK